MPNRLLALPSVMLLALASTACGAGPPPPNTAEDATGAAPCGQDFASATEFIQHLTRLARAGDGAGVEAAVDTDFARRLPSDTDLLSLFRSLPRGCELSLSEGPGYSAVAIPPPMVDDSDEDAARIEALVDELRASTEVEATCAPPSGGSEGPRMLYAIATRRGSEGWRALAWRDYRDELR